MAQGARVKEERVSEGIVNRGRKTVAKKLETQASDCVVKEKTVAITTAATEKRTGKRSKSDDCKDSNKTHKPESKRPR